jgi:hypothetical protein
MKKVNFDLFKCRCSKINALLACSAENKPITPTQLEELAKLEKKDKDKLTLNQSEKLVYLQMKMNTPKEVPLGEGAITYLMEWYALEIYGKISVDKESLELLPTEKGKKVEADSISMLSRFDGVLYEKNDIKVENDFLRGEPDVFSGEHIMAAKSLTDMKNSWDYPGFLKQINKPLEKNYIKQVQGYGDITGATELSITRCIVNMPIEMIKEYYDKVARKMGVIDTDTAYFQEIWEQWEQSMIFDDIPVNLRIHKTKVEPFSQEERDLLYDRVKYSRDWLWKFHETYSLLNT